MGEIIVLCDHCIEAIRSHGEAVIVLGESDLDEYRDNFNEELKCEWCEDENDILFDCVFA